MKHYDSNSTASTAPSTPPSSAAPRFNTTSYSHRRPSPENTRAVRAARREEIMMRHRSIERRSRVERSGERRDNERGGETRRSSSERRRGRDTVNNNGGELRNSAADLRISCIDSAVEDIIDGSRTAIRVRTASGEMVRPQAGGGWGRERTRQTATAAPSRERRYSSAGRQRFASSDRQETDESYFRSKNQRERDAAQRRAVSVPSRRPSPTHPDQSRDDNMIRARRRTELGRHVDSRRRSERGDRGKSLPADPRDRERTRFERHGNTKHPPSSSGGGGGNGRREQEKKLSSREAEKKRILAWSSEFNEQRSKREQARREKSRDGPTSSGLNNSSNKAPPPPYWRDGMSRRHHSSGRADSRFRSRPSSRGRPSQGRSGRDSSGQHRSSSRHRRSSKDALLPALPPSTTRPSSNNRPRSKEKRRSRSSDPKILALPFSTNKPSSNSNNQASVTPLKKPAPVSTATSKLTRTKSDADRKKEAIRQANVSLLSSQISGLNIESSDKSNPHQPTVTWTVTNAPLKKTASFDDDDDSATIELDDHAKNTLSRQIDWKQLGQSLRLLRSSEGSDSEKEKEILSKSLSAIHEIDTQYLNKIMDPDSSVPTATPTTLERKSSSDCNPKDGSYRRSSLAGSSKNESGSKRDSAGSSEKEQRSERCLALMAHSSLEETKERAVVEKRRSLSMEAALDDIMDDITSLRGASDDAIVVRGASDDAIVARRDSDTVGLGSMALSMSEYDYDDGAMTRDETYEESQQQTFNESIDVIHDTDTIGTAGLGSMAYGSYDDEDKTYESKQQTTFNESQQNTFNESIDVIEKNQDSIIDFQVNARPLKHRVSSLNDSQSVDSSVPDTVFEVEKISFSALRDIIRRPSKPVSQIDSESCSLFPEAASRRISSDNDDDISGRKIDEIMSKIMKCKEKSSQSGSKGKSSPQQQVPKTNKTASTAFKVLPQKKVPPPPPRRAAETLEAKPPPRHKPPAHPIQIPSPRKTTQSPPNVTSRPSPPPLSPALRKRASTGVVPENSIAAPISPKPRKKDPIDHIMSQLEQIEQPSPGPNNELRRSATHDNYGQGLASPLNRRNTTDAAPTRHPGRSNIQSGGVHDMPYRDTKGGHGVYNGDVDQWGRPHGEGRIDYDSGGFFEGQWINGEPFHEPTFQPQPALQGPAYQPQVMNHPVTAQMYGGMMPQAPAYNFNNSAGNFNMSMNSFNNSLNPYFRRT